MFPPDVQLIEDDRGVKGMQIGLGCMGKAGGIGPVFFSLRPDCVSIPVGCSGFYMHAVPRKWRKGTSVEHYLRRLIYAALKRHRGDAKEGTSKLFALKDESWKIFNWMYARILETARPDTFKLARRFSKEHRSKIYQLATQHERFRQLAETWPALAVDVATCGSNNPALDMVLYGEPLDSIAEFCAISRYTRKVRPQLCHLGHVNALCSLQGEQVSPFIPKTTLGQQRFFCALENMARYPVTVGVARWFAKNVPLHARAGRLLQNDCDQILDFFRSTGNYEPKMSWENAWKRAQQWHNEEVRRANERMRLRAVEDEKPFPSPWIPGATVHGYEIVPLTSPQELNEEGAAMHHCVGSYARNVRGGHCYIYSVRKDGNRLATLELGKGYGSWYDVPPAFAVNSYRVAQLRAACNAEPSPVVRAAVESWLASFEDLEEKKRRRECASSAISLHSTEPDGELASGSRFQVGMASYVASVDRAFEPEPLRPIGWAEVEGAPAPIRVYEPQPELVW